MIEDTIREIRKRLRLAMNGVISTSMREKGITYKLNFGVPLPEIKQIAASFEPGTELASALWKEDIREFKILATFLQPVDDFPLEQAEQWTAEIPYLEIAEQCSRNLFCKLPYAEDLVLGLIFNTREEYARTTAFLVLGELFKANKNVIAPVKAAFMIEAMRSLAKPLFAATFKERQSAVKAMKFYGRQSVEQSGQILNAFGTYPDFESRPDLKEIYNDLKFEFDYYR